MVSMNAGLFTLPRSGFVQQAFESDSARCPIFAKTRKKLANIASQIKWAL
ncbi:hypothetical protein ACPSKX_15145 [Moritella viscosa]|nr:hypothetical protein [Moritella viscosa]